MLLILPFFLLSVPGALSGSSCPPRPAIYPCSCANVPLRAKHRMATVVTCRGVTDSDSLAGVMPGLRDVEVDQLHVLDAFWGAEADKKSLPENWFTLHKVKDLEIADSELDSCFVCPGRGNCRDSATTRFAISNSSSWEKMCSSCKQPWTSCLGRLKEFSLTRGRLTSVGADLFPVEMSEMLSLNLSRNQIVKLDPGFLRNLPKLLKLDLSHNAIEYIDHVFKGKVLKLEHLDVSWNLIKSLGADLFVSLPKLKRLQADNNYLAEMKEAEWKNAPPSLKHIDLSDNRIHCDCSLRWVNASFPINTLVMGSCFTPPEYSSTPLRRASRFLTERCSPGGDLGTRPPSTPSTTPTTTTTTTRSRRRQA